jgi:hypothetical protein
MVRYKTVQRVQQILMIVIFLVIGFWPITTMNGPPWEVWVVDQSGQPVPGITVRESYKICSIQHPERQKDLYTDNSGHVIFYPRMVRASSAVRLVSVVVSAITGPHASFSPHAYVFAFGKGMEGFVESNGSVTDWTGSPLTMNSKIVVTPARIP